jgi:hypothetical protein
MFTDIAVIWLLFNFFSTELQKIGKILTVCHKRNVKYSFIGRQYLGNAKRIQICGWFVFDLELSLFPDFFIGCKHVKNFMLQRLDMCAHVGCSTLRSLPNTSMTRVRQFFFTCCD